MAISVEMILAVLSFLSIFSIGAAAVITRSAHRRVMQSRLLAGGSRVSTTGDLVEDRRDELGLLAKLASVFAPSKPSEGLKARLAKSGFHHPAAPAVYLGARMALLIVGLTGAALVTLPLEIAISHRVFFIVLGGTVLSFLPDLVIARRRALRRREVQETLPHAVDLLEICVSSGMGMDMAWNSVADEIRPVSPTLADEMALTNLEMQLGVHRTEALRHMVDRTGAEEDLGSLVAVLVQSERFGTSISDALKTFAETMREIRSQRAHETAEKMAVKLLFPLVLFIFPVIFIVVAGPAAMRIIELMSST